MAYVRIEDDVVQERIETDPATSMHPTLAVLFIDVDDTVQVGDLHDNGVFTTPSEGTPDPEPTVYPVLTPMEYKLLFTIAERNHLRSQAPTDDILKDVFEMLNDVRLTEVDLNLQNNHDSLDHCLDVLVTGGILLDADKASRKAEILTGVPLKV